MLVTCAGTSRQRWLAHLASQVAKNTSDFAAASAGVRLFVWFCMLCMSACDPETVRSITCSAVIVESGSFSGNARGE
jgi:phosphatidylserine decarboxylase